MMDRRAGALKAPASPAGGRTAGRACRALLRFPATISDADAIPVSTSTSSVSRLGKYHLLRKIGAGGMAEVYLAKSYGAEGLEKQLVIKKILPAYAQNARFISMFIDEAKIAVSLNHPNIVQVYEFGQVGTDYYLAMEYVEGLDLNRLLGAMRAASVRLPLGLAVFLVVEVAKGLDYAHRKRDSDGDPLAIVHRDISPQNVITSTEGGVKILDFGIARARDVSEDEGVVKGKFSYMSPEQAAAQSVDHRSDIFSLGILLFELTTGKPLFSGPGNASIADAVRAAVVPNPRELNPQISPELARIITTALARKVEARYQSARDLQTDLTRVLYALPEIYDSAALAALVTRMLPSPTAPVPRLEPGGATPSMPSPLQPPPPGAEVVARAVDGLMGAEAHARPISPDTFEPGQEPVAGAAAPRAVREKKSVVVVHGDLQGFSALRKHLPEDQVRGVLLDYIRIVESIAYKNDAVRDRLTEDNCLLVVGLPVADETDPARSVRMARDIIEAIEGINRNLPVPLRISAGVHRGQALVTRSPARRDLDYQLLGDVATTAERLAREAMPGEILVGGGVFRDARRDLRFEQLESIDIPVADEGSDPGAPPQRAQVYRFLGGKGRAERLREVRAGYRVLYGRDLELKVLTDAYHEVVRDRQARYLAVVGDTGIGKSSLLAEFGARLEREPTLPGEPAGTAERAAQRGMRIFDSGRDLVLRAACYSHSGDQPYSLGIDLLRDLLGVSEDESPRQLKGKLESFVTALYQRTGATPLVPDPDLAEPDVASLEQEQEYLLHAMGLLLGIKYPGSLIEALDAEQRQRRTALSFVNLLGRLSTDRTVVALVEDVHWADSVSLRLLREMVGFGYRRPILVVLTLRREDPVEPLLAVPGITSLALGELPPSDRERLVADRFGDKNDARELSRLILTKAGGNPFFIKELIESLIDRKIVTIQDGPEGRTLQWERRGADFAVPTTVEGVIGSRIDQLAPKEKEALQHAAAFGRRLSSEALEYVLGREVKDDLRRLERKGLLARWAPRPGHNEPPTYAFKSRLVQELAYGGLLPDDRQRLHRRIADRLVARTEPAPAAGTAPGGAAAGAAGGAANGRTTRPPLASPAASRPGSTADLARHLELAGEHAEAGLRYLAAGEEAAQAYSNAEALRFYTKALALLPPDHHARFTVHEHREQLLRGLTRRRDQLREIASMRRLARRAEDGARLALTLNRLARLLLDAGKPENAGRVLARTLDVARRSGDRGAEVEALRQRAVHEKDLGRYQEALATCKEALERCGSSDGEMGRAGLKQRGTILISMGVVNRQMGRLREAVGNYAEALVIYRHLGIRRLESQALNNLGVVSASLGEYEEALNHYRQTIKIDQEIGDRYSTGYKLANIGQLYSEVGDFARALKYLRKALELHLELEDQIGEADTLITMGQAYDKLEVRRDAGECLERGFELATRGKHRYLEVRGAIYLALHLISGEARGPGSSGAPASAGQAERALELAQRATQLARESAITVGMVYGLTAQARVLALRRRFPEALAKSEEAIALIQKQGQVEGSEEVFFVHSRILREAALVDASRSYLVRAYEEVVSKVKRLRDPHLRRCFLAVRPQADILAAYQREVPQE
jgi:serine/threonine protein kinase/predicted ATPase